MFERPELLMLSQSACNDECSGAINNVVGVDDYRESAFVFPDNMLHNDNCDGPDHVCGMTHATSRRLPRIGASPVTISLHHVVVLLSNSKPKRAEGAAAGIKPLKS